jgi:hypothetical protein
MRNVIFGLMQEDVRLEFQKLLCADGRYSPAQGVSERLFLPGF